jgi:APA family basic amino acid/polyamine antiporter
VVLPLKTIQSVEANRVGTAAMQAIFGDAGKIIMAIAIMISTFGCNNGLILAGARVYYAMARDGLFFRRTATINRHSVPAAALIAQAIWTVFLTLPRTVATDPTTGALSYGNVYTQLLEYIVSADLVFYVLLVVAVIVLRKTRPAVDRPYRMRGYPMVPIISVVLAAFLIVDLAWLAPTTSGIGYLFVLSGIPVYLIWRRGFSGDRNTGSTL